jgi:uncharacterized protein YgiM (DUF1202 family)
MKMNHALILATMLSTSVLAQTANNTVTPPAPAPTAEMTPSPDTSTNLPPVKKSLHKKKTATTKKSTTAKSASAATNVAPPAMFAAGDLGVAKQNNINIRAQSHINSEVIGHVQKGEAVTVLEEVVLKHPKTDEPARWLRIALPSSNHVWIDTQYINTTNNTVWAHKLNMRGGPGENYSVIGQLRRDDVVTPIGTKDKWTEIAAPEKAYAFVAAHLFSRKEAPPTPPVSTTPPTVAAVETPPNLAPATGEVPAGVTPPAAPAPAAVEPVPIPAPAPAADEPPPKRIVEREGIVGGTVSIQSPSHYELHSLDNGKTMDYLYSTTTNVMLGRYRGLTVLVAGEEELDERWPNTPVLTIQKIQVVK